MNDFEKIYTVIKTQYSCGVPYYNYGVCLYDELSQNYIQEGKLDLLKSVDYSNVPLNDIPVACNQPINTIITCSPPVLEINKPEPGFRLKFQNSAYLNDTLLLKSPSDYKETLFIMENTGANTCLKSVFLGQYISYDSSNNITWANSCSDTNNIVYESNKLKFIYSNLCINPKRYYASIPNNENLTLSSCSLNISVEKETPDMPLVIISDIISLSSISSISSIYISQNTIPTTMGNVIPTKYNVVVPSTLPTSVRTKVKISNVSALLLVMYYYQIINMEISTVYITKDKGKTWNVLPISYDNDRSITDISMSQDGKYILIIENNFFYYSSDFGNTFTSKLIDRIYSSGYLLNWSSDKKVTMSLDGRVQIAFINQMSVRIDNSNTLISLIQVSYDYGKTFIKSIFNYPFSDLILSKNGDILMVTIFDKNTLENTNIYLNNNSSYIFKIKTFDSRQEFQISNDSKNIYVLLENSIYYSNDYGITWKTNNLTSLFTKLYSLGITIKRSSKNLCISLSGKYVFILLSGLIGYSKDYGENFELFLIEDNTLNNTLIDWQGIDILPDGSQLILSDRENVYFLNTNESPDVLSINKQKIIFPSNEFKYLYNTNITYNRVLKSGREIFIIDDDRVSLYYGNIIVNLSNVPTTISSICITDKGIFYTIFNKIFDQNNKEVFSTSSNFVHITSNKQGNLFLALSTLIHISRDGFIWNTINLQSRKWVMGCISSEFNMFNAHTLSCIEEYGNVFVSRDSGLRWTANKEQNSYFWNSISMSNDGMIQIATCRENLPVVSYDYGLTFNSIKFDYNLKDLSGKYIRDFVDCSVSEDGIDFIAVCKNGQIIYSNKNTDWKIYGQYNYNRTELDLSDNYYIVNNTLYNSQFDFLTFRLFSTLTYIQPPAFLSPVTNNVLNSFESYSTSSSYNFILPYNNFKLPYNYTGKSNTYDAENKININAEYIEFVFPPGMMFKIDKFIINSGMIKGVITNKFNNIKNLRIMGSNDNVNYYEILNVTDNSTPFDLKKLVFVTRSNKYYNQFRIVLDGVINIGRLSYLSGISFEGVMNVSCANENIVSNDWKKVSFKSGNILLARDKLYIGTKQNMIFSNFRFMTLSNIVYSTNTTLTSDIFCENLTINSNVTLSTNGFRIFCTSKLINNGLIENNGIDGSKGLGGAINDNLQRTLGMGGNGGNGSTVIGVRALNGGSRQFCIVNSFGGNGGSRTSLGGTGGVCVVIQNQNALYNSLNAIAGKDASGNIIQGGAGGGGGEKGTTTNNGGGGGGGGGVIMICAYEIINNGFISANGGRGESFSTYSSSLLTGASGGGGGGGGTVIVVTSSFTNLTRILLNGGNSGTREFNTTSTTLSGGNGSRGNPGRIILVRV